jgi:hypothetical protein
VIIHIRRVLHLSSSHVRVRMNVELTTFIRHSTIHVISTWTSSCRSSIYDRWNTSYVTIHNAYSFGILLYRSRIGIAMYIGILYYQCCQLFARQLLSDAFLTHFLTWESLFTHRCDALARFGRSMCDTGDPRFDTHFTERILVIVTRKRVSSEIRMTILTFMRYYPHPRYPWSSIIRAIYVRTHPLYVLNLIQYHIAIIGSRYLHVDRHRFHAIAERMYTYTHVCRSRTHQ